MNLLKRWQTGILHRFLPGISHFTVIDDQPVSQQDAGNNFFLDGYRSIWKSRAMEAVALLCELNDSVEGKADMRNSVLVNNWFYAD
jgi:hypothetical protein